MTATPVIASAAPANGSRSIAVTRPSMPTASWRARIDAASFLRGHRLASIRRSLGSVRKGGRRPCRARTKRAQDAGSVNMRSILARPRTPDRAGLQPPGAPDDSFGQAPTEAGHTPSMVVGAQRLTVASLAHAAQLLAAGLDLRAALELIAAAAAEATAADVA